MAVEDKKKWNSRYLNNPIPDRPISLIVEYAALASKGEALDIACGMGRHSKYLASEGFCVDALDVSTVAIESLSSMHNINAKEVDFDSYRLMENHYDLIVCSYFLKRELFPQITDALKEQGLLIYETFVYHSKNEQVPSKKEYLLEEKELLNAFQEKLNIIYYDEYWDTTMKGAKMRKASLVARKG